MLRKTSDLMNFTVRAHDGDVGKVDDFYFDDNQWTLRYFVVNTGPWLFGRKVLISPQAFEPPLWSDRTIPVDLNQEQVEKSPDIDLDQPVSRQQETTLRNYYRWPAYWGAAPVYFSRPTVAAMAPLIAPTVEETGQPQDEPAEHSNDVTSEPGDPHLRSVAEVTGYAIHTTDGIIGHVDDFFVDEHDWRIHLLVVDTRNWLPGKKVLISPDRIERVSWDEKAVHVSVDKDRVHNSPEYDPVGGDDVGATGLYMYQNFHV